MEKQFRSMQLRAIPRIFNGFLVRNHSATLRNKIAEAIIARNFAQRKSDWKPYLIFTLYNVIYVHLVMNMYI